MEHFVEVCLSINQLHLIIALLLLQIKILTLHITMLLMSHLLAVTMQCNAM